MFDDKNVYSEELLDRSDLIARILIAGEEFKEGLISKMQYYDLIRDLIVNDTKALN